MNLAIDFDGTIASGGFPNIALATEVEGAIDTLTKLKEQGHILILNTDKEYPKGINAQEAINMAEKKALIIIPHPFDITRKGVGSKLYKLKGYHAIEVNARCLFDYFNKKAIKYSRVHNVPLVAGSDSHFPQEIGNAYITVKAKTIKEAIKKIKQGKNKTYLKKRKIKKKLGPYLKSAIGYTKH